MSTKTGHPVQCIIHTHLRIVRREEVRVDARGEGHELVVDGGERVQHLDDGLK